MRRPLALLATAVVLAAPVQTTPAPVAPVDGPVVAPFDPPATPYGPGHRGVDLAAPPGAPVRAALPGDVTFAGPVAGQHWVTVTHGTGLDTTYGVLSEPAVTVGERVAAGQVLGRLAAGATHLDWGARLDGEYVDPLGLLARWRPALAPLRPPDPVARPESGGQSMRWPAVGTVTSGFGYRTHPVHGGRRLHAGMDIAAPTGTPVVAARAGAVTFAGWRGGYGLLVVIDHGGGVTTRYAHLSATLVRPGQQVDAGQLIGRIGSTGDSTGPHLHFEVRLGGVAVDPRPWLG